MELVVCGNVFLNGRLEKCCVGIEDGKIAAIKKVLKGETELDYGDKLILPAGIDIHVHFRQPGGTEKEDFESGSLSAAFGGLSCIMDMPNTKPPTLDPESFSEKKKIARRSSFIDFGLYSGVTERTNLAKMAELATGFKLYLGETTGKLVYNDLEKLKAQLEALPEGTDKVFAVHAEDSQILADSAKSIPEEDNKNLRTHLNRRPAGAEVKAIGAINDLKNSLIKARARIKFHICHISSAESLGFLKDTTGLSTEVTPHHLLLSIDNNQGLGTMAKVNPPIRREDDRRALWQALIDNRLEIIGSDHAPHTHDDKELPFSEAPSGLPGVETTMPLLLSMVKHGQLSLQRFVGAISEKPSALFALNKGRIAVGNDADLIAVDMRCEETLKPDMLHYKCEWTPYRNMQVIFPKMTICRGRIVVKDGGIEGEHGQGNYIR
jgi:dihydroorotase